MNDPIALIVSVLALAVSIATAWLTLMRKGTIKMTQPTVIFFGPDSPRENKQSALPKVYLRTLIFATSKRGRIVESMHISLERSETRQNFNIWIYGNDDSDKLVRGSGLFVGETGFAANHHFLTPEDGAEFRFLAGRYRFEVNARLLGDKTPIRLFSQDLEVTPHLATQLEQKNAGLYFDWSPESSRYMPQIKIKKSAPFADPNEFLAAFGLDTVKDSTKISQ
jgi:hypothetical protein